MVQAIVLAAGEGKRMRSALPKVLHPVLEEPMLAHVLRALAGAGVRHPLVVVGRGAEAVEQTFAGRASFVHQDPPRGTGDALRVALQHLGEDGPVLVVQGDTPLWRKETLASFLSAVKDKGSGLVSAELDDPEGYGRIVRHQGRLLRIVEERDASAQEREIKEVNAGLYLLDRALARSLLGRLGTANDQGEFYLTDLIGLMADEGPLTVWPLLDPREMQGVNDRRQLAEANAILRRRVLEHWLDNGVTITDPESTWIGAGVEIAEDVVIEAGVRILGQSRIGRRSRIGAASEVIESVVGEACHVRSSVVEASQLGSRVTVGPLAHVRAGCVIADEVEIGNFAELKNTRLGEGSKAHHHCYLGDAEIGSRVNIGAGAITVNYDGRVKHRTVIGDGAFIGCNVNLIAPLTIGAGAYVAAGSTVTQAVPEKALAVARERQRNIEGWSDRRLAKHKEE